jgi:hypothetical protein
MKPSSFLNMALMLAAASGSLRASAATITLNLGDDVTTDTTWTSDNVYFLTGPVFVTGGATLTIQPGTVVRGQAGNWDVLDPPGALIVSRGSKIRAVGTKTQPIIMTCENDNLVPGMTATSPWNDPTNGERGHWGGLVVLGRTYIAAKPGSVDSPNAGIVMQIEGLIPYGEKSTYGGGNDDDNSGEIKYLQIRYGGFVIGGANELNGLSLGGVGRGTKISFVDVFNNKDDSIEFFGGTVNTKYMVAWKSGDDSFDWDEGFRGKGQFWLEVQGALTGDVSDKGSEMDGATGTDAGQPSSCPTIYNATYIGLGKNCGNKKNTALNFRDGTAGRFYNSMFLDFGGACGIIEGATGGSYDSADNTVANYVQDAYYTHATESGKKLEIENCYFGNNFNNTIPGWPVNTTNIGGEWGTDGTDGNKAALAYDLTVANTVGTYTFADNAVVDGPLYFERTATARAVNSINYYNLSYLTGALDTGSPWLTAGRTVPAGDDFFTPVTFVGAFGKSNWMLGWTTAAALDVVAFESGTGMVDGDYESLAPVPTPVIEDMFQSVTLEFGTVDGVTYRVEASDTANFAVPETVGTVDGTGDYVRFSDMQKMGAARFYRVVAQD